MERSDTFLLGIFLNQARLNAYITLCHISDLLEENIVDEDSLSTMPVLKYLEMNKDIIKSQRAFKLIEERFPMLKAIYDWQKEKGKEDETWIRSKAYKNILTCLLLALNCKRNQYCHAYSPDVLADKVDINELCRCLYKCFDASVNVVKERQKLDEKNVVHLRRFKEGKEKGKSEINPNFRYLFKNERGQLTDIGLAFLTTLFLDKKDSYEFLKSQSGFKRGETPAKKATLESFCVYRVRLPKPVMSSDVDKNGLALDMLNELKKCPRELFDLLPPQQQQNFRVKGIDDDEDTDEILMMRYGDRLPYLALRYCDENELFKNLRFQIDLGKYYFKGTSNKAVLEDKFFSNDF